MAPTLTPKWRGVGLVAAIIALAAVARLPYLMQANLSPDATDYINIARNIARGRGLVHTIKWHFFTSDPAVHSAIGERPLLYPLLLAPFCRGDYPARACQYVTLLMTVAALAVGAAWARRMGQSGRAVAITTILLAFNPGLLVCSIYPWTEPLYLLSLFGVMLVVGDDAESRWAARLAALLTALAYMTRPSAAAIVLGLASWYLYRGAFRPLANYLLTLVVLLIPWWAIVWVVRGNPLYCVQSFHLVVNDIRDGMASGYGVVFPGPVEFFFTRTGTILTKVGAQTIAYMEQLFGPTYLSVFSVLAFLRLLRRRERNQNEGARSDGPCYAIALWHFVLTAMTWATFESLRFMAPCFALLVVPVVAEMDYLVGRLAPNRARVAAWSTILAVTGVVYGEAWGQIYQRVANDRTRDLVLQVARIEFDRIVELGAAVACSDPFSINYYFDRPAIMLPEASDSPQRVQMVEQFVNEYRPNYMLLTPNEVKVLSPLVAGGRLRSAGTLEAIPFQIFRVTQTVP